MIKRTLVRAFILSACALFLVSTLDAQTTGAYKRLKLIEEYTSTTCGPCAGAAPVMNAAVGIAKDVISIRYHVPIPVAGDPWYAMNQADNDARMSYYGVNSAPFCQVGGLTFVDLISGGQASGSARLNNALSSVPPTSFVRVTVTQSGPKIVVKVKTDRALTNATLQLAALTRYLSWPTVPGTNGEKEFYDILLKMYPNAEGTVINQAANEERTYEFTPSIGSGQTWAGKQYFAAWVQDNASKEVLQAGITQTTATPPDYDYPTATAVTATVTGGAAYMRVDRGAQSSTNVVLSNSSASPVTVNLVVDNQEALADAGMSVVIAPSTLTVPANGTATAVTTVTGPDNSIYVSILRSYSASDALGRSIANVNYLVNGAKVVNYYATGAQWAPAINQVTAQNSTTYSKDVVYMPYATDVLTNYPMTDFGAAIFAFDVAWTEFRGANVTNVENMLRAKKGVWVQTQSAMLAAFERYPAEPAFNSARAFYSTMGLEYISEVFRVNTDASGNITGVNTFGVKGVTGDPIGNGITFTANQYSPSAFPFFVVGTDLIKIASGSKAKPVLYYDNNQANLGMIRVEPTYGGRLVYGSVGAEAIADNAIRLSLTDKVLNWLLNAQATEPKIAVSQGTLNYGAVEVNETKELSFTLTNTGNAELTITDFAITGADAVSFDITSGGIVNGNPIKIAAGGTRNISVTFAPTTKKTIFGAALAFVSDATGAPTVQLRGSSTVTSVETDVVSETGAIGLTLVGSNPIADNSAVRLTSTGNVTVTVVDAAGRTVSTLFDGTVNGTETVSIASSTLTSGTYSIVATNGADRAVLTVVVVR